MVCALAEEFYGKITVREGLRTAEDRKLSASEGNGKGTETSSSGSRSLFGPDALGFDPDQLSLRPGRAARLIADMAARQWSRGLGWVHDGPAT